MKFKLPPLKSLDQAKQRAQDAILFEAKMFRLLALEESLFPSEIGTEDMRRAHRRYATLLSEHRFLGLAEEYIVEGLANEAQYLLRRTKERRLGIDVGRGA